MLKVYFIYKVAGKKSRRANPEMAGFKISWFWPSTNPTTSK
jgi:hypothetical protein